MIKTIVLRYSNSETKTIDEHKSILDDGSQGSVVFWGWWRPDDEEKRTDVLDELSSLLRAGPIRVGLVNTKDGEYYVASCGSVIYDHSGMRVHSPAPTRTPKYYRDSDFPAWFKFMSIEKLNEQDWISEFGPPPTSHDTLFALTPDAKVGATPKKAPPIIKAPGNAILHISDLHFGDFHGFPTSAGESGRFEDSLDAVISKTAKIYGESGSRVGVLVVSGDLISKGNANDYGQVRAFLERLCASLKIEKEHVIIVPGNHDIYLKNSQHVTRDYSERMPFVDFMRSFFAKDIKEIGGVHRYDLPNGKILSFAALNSVRPRTEQLKDFGYVGADIYQPLLKQLDVEGFDASREIRLAVFHHHLVLPPIKVWPMEENRSGGSLTRPISVMLDAGPMIRDLQRANVRFALHGHHHFPFIAQAGFREKEECREVIILGGGSAGAKRDQLEEAFSHNTVGIYLPHADQMSVEIWQYNRVSDPSIHWKGEIPL